MTTLSPVCMPRNAWVKSLTPSHLRRISCTTTAPPSVFAFLRSLSAHHADIAKRTGRTIRLPCRELVVLLQRFQPAAWTRVVHPFGSPLTPTLEDALVLRLEYRGLVLAAGDDRRETHSSSHEEKKERASEKSRFPRVRCNGAVAITTTHGMVAKLKKFIHTKEENHLIHPDRLPTNNRMHAKPARMPYVCSRGVESRRGLHVHGTEHP